MYSGPSSVRYGRIIAVSGLVGRSALWVAKHHAQWAKALGRSVRLCSMPRRLSSCPAACVLPADPPQQVGVGLRPGSSGRGGVDAVRGGSIALNAATKSQQTRQTREPPGKTCGSGVTQALKRDSRTGVADTSRDGATGSMCWSSMLHRPRWVLRGCGAAGSVAQGVAGPAGALGLFWVLGVVVRPRPVWVIACQDCR